MLGALESLESEIARDKRSSGPDASDRRALSLANRAADFQAAARTRKRHRRRRRRSPSGSRSSASSERDFRGSRGSTTGDAADVARRSPGLLLEECLGKTRRYLTTQQGATTGSDPLSPVVTSYLTSVLLPAAGPNLSLRNSGELRNLAEALDCLLSGNVMGAADVLAQRFRSVETAHFDGGWAQAKHLEVVGESRVSSLDVKDRRRIAKLAREETKLKPG